MVGVERGGLELRRGFDRGFDRGAGAGAGADGRTGAGGASFGLWDRAVVGGDVDLHR